MLKKESHFVLACMALLAVLFLSSIAAPGGANVPRTQYVSPRVDGSNPFSGARGFDITMEKDFPTEWQPPIEYLYFDTSTALEGWYDALLLLLMLEEQYSRQHGLKE